MSRYAAGCLTTAGSTTLPIISLYGGAGVRPHIQEIGIFNASSVAVALKLVRLTSTGTRGTALTNASIIGDDPAAAIAAAYGTHTVAPTLGQDIGYRTILGAAPGSGCIWTWPEREFSIPTVAGAGVGVIVENGTGQACQAYIKWIE